MTVVQTSRGAVRVVVDRRLSLDCFLLSLIAYSGFAVWLLFLFLSF